MTKHGQRGVKVVDIGAVTMVNIYVRTVSHKTTSAVISMLNILNFFSA